MKGSGFARGLLLGGCVIFSAATAQAGFQWTAPMGGLTSGAPSGTMAPMGRTNELPPRAAAAPVAPVMSESLPASMGAINAGAPIATTPDGPVHAAPIYGQGPAGAMTNDPITWNAPVQQHNAAIATPDYTPRGPQNIMPAEAVPLTPVTATPMMTAPVSAAYSQYTVAEGFGRDLPLAMAIRQIVPAQFGFVFGQGIDVSSHVSWQGGRPWDLVLQDTLAPMGMTASINGNVVSITRTGAAPVMQTAMTGPQLVTDTVQTTTTTTMTATPVSMTSGPVVQDMGMGNSGYLNARTSAGTADLMSSNSWSAPRNSTLRNILEGWCERVGVELYWASEYDYPIQSAVSLQGTFEDAVQTLLKGLSDSKPRPLGRLHPNLPNGPAVLVIETRQNSM